MEAEGAGLDGKGVVDKIIDKDGWVWESFSKAARNFEDFSFFVVDNSR